MEENNHIYPIFDKMLMRKDKEDLLKQHSVMVWFTGLSGSGKSTIAIALEFYGGRPCGEYPAYSRSFQTLS